jgi:outer membrane autotransporter protein
VTGQFGGVDDLIFFQPILTKDANNVYLELLPVFPGTDPDPGQDPNDPGNPRPRPVPPLQPETAPPVTILHHENLFRAAILCRLRCSSSDAMGAVPSFVAIDSVPVQYTADLAERNAPVAAPVAEAPASRGTGWGVWGKVLGSFGRTDAMPASAAMERTTGGMVVGVDGGLGTPYRLGIAAGYLATSSDIDAAAASMSTASTSAPMDPPPSGPGPCAASWLTPITRSNSPVAPCPAASAGASRTPPPIPCRSPGRSATRSGSPTASPWSRS